MRLEEVARPAPLEDEVLVMVHATTVTRTDCHVLGARPFVWRLITGLHRPRRRILGMEFAGKVAELGRAVRDFEIGDAVFGITGLAFGAHAEYVCIPASGPVAIKPRGVGFDVAAASLDGPTDALAKLRRAGVSSGQRVLVYGASGSIGTAAVQLAKLMGGEVTGVCGASNLELVRSLGADSAIDYEHEDFTANGETYDVIFDAVGKESFIRCRRSLRPGGRFVFTDGWMNFVWLLVTRAWGNRRVVFANPQRTKDDVMFIKELIETGGYRPVIDRDYPLDEIVAAAQYVETERKTGNVVLTVRGDDDA
jgi:NADPH:quinone reductase-like Zn-dependent oxidoreductase